MENQKNRLIFLCSDSIFDILLVLAKKFWVKLNVTRFVDTMNISETGGNREVRGDWRQSLVDGKDVLGLGIERIIVNRLVVNTILLTTCDTNFLESTLAKYISQSSCL